MPDDPPTRYIGRVEKELKTALAEALAALDDAEVEIARIRYHLERAEAGLPHDDIGEVRGPNAQKIFHAFGALRTLRELRAGENMPRRS